MRLKHSIIPVPTTIYTDTASANTSHGGSLLTTSARSSPNDIIIHRSQSLPRLAPDSDVEEYKPSSYLSDASDFEDTGELGLEPSPVYRVLSCLQPTQHIKSSINHDPELQRRLHGKSSAIKLVQATIELRKQYLDTLRDSPQSFNPVSSERCEHQTHRRVQFWTSPPVSITPSFMRVDVAQKLCIFSKWEIAWEDNASGPLPSFVADAMPPKDLAEELIELYFVHINDIFSLLHRPSFEHYWDNGLHTRNVWFAAVTLSVFGIASRWSKDPRILPTRVHLGPSNDNDEVWSLAGFQFIKAAMGELS